LVEPSSEGEDEILDRLAEWQQGDFALDCGDFLFRDLAEEGDETDFDGGAVFDAGVLGFAVISQTCDIVRRPIDVGYVSVCPLVKIDPKRIADIERGQAPRYGLLSNTPEAVVVDFSRTMSVTKDLLLTWTRSRGCEDDQQQLDFARSLELFFGRFAFPDDFVISVTSLRRAILDKYGKDGSDFGKASRSIRELRAVPHAAWSDTESVPVSFVAILDDEEKREIKDRNKIGELLKPAIDAIKWKAPFSLHPDGLGLFTLSDLTAADYLNSYPLDVNSLSFARKYKK
jgi:hypothetical protein